MNEIDWSKAPEWAGAVVESERGVQFWVSQFGGTSARQRIGSLYPEEDARADMTDDDHGWLLIEKRPPPAWNGEGLPPAGTVCEYYWAADDSWRAGTCVAHFDGRAVICDADDEDCAERLDAHHVRAIRTPEQIAAEEREKAVAAMLELDPYLPNTTLGMMSRADFCRTLYDNNYRKVEGGSQ